MQIQDGEPVYYQDSYKHLGREAECDEISFTLVSE